MTKVTKLDFLNKFKEANFFEPEDRFKIGVLYFISTCLTSSEASKKTIPKLYFDLVKSDQYVNFPWVDIRVSTGTPRILNWNTSNESIFFKDLNNTIFRTYGNHHKFKNIVLTDEEMNVIDQNNLHESSSHHETENQATSERKDVDFDENYVELKKETAEVDKHMTELKAYVHNSTKLIIDEIKSSRGQPTQTSHQENSIDQTVGGVFNADILGSSTSKPPTLDDYPDLTMTQIVELDLILNANTTPDVQPRNRNPDKYDTSPYIRLSKGDSSVRRGPIFCCIKHPFESHNGFEVAAELIDEFNKWVFKGVSPKPGRPWKDGWRDSNYDMSFISPDHDVGQCIRGFKLLANIPWDRVDDIIIPVNVSKSFH
ncbi:hypothetical protein KY290_031262 [Solanum tuberosum]|uniref:Ulp1 protease family, C-terminal catalytic domain containing protein n=1 Tax=Solanum tuberosum TaxID=4113 RepID=A0ABQ7UAI2_SOLTU|nr:hypothetical protein KY290_031262 [Solanum tuberosum]